MQINSKGEGLAAFFKKWKVPLVEEFFTGCSMNSGQAYKYLQNHAHEMEDPELKRSRASVIFFLNDLVDDGILEYEEKTGKGGYHRVYTMKLSREQFGHKLIALFVGKVLEAFPDASKTFMWPRP